MLRRGFFSVFFSPNKTRRDTRREANARGPYVIQRASPKV